ncbi:hypothetical protein BDV95DRAFT_593437 [Massariosphaeria phaeospora]|uniref:Uncharacterized protein n=1 Tax=Massariosphaeria phaeospora TaxID=100035 RepID=A0A7C8MA90_9PLEO|nr:hypothetical protein BDV95DRAFT_593437 [Massariosphaeria phaeospora]
MRGLILPALLDPILLQGSLGVVVVSSSSSSSACGNEQTRFGVEDVRIEASEAMSVTNGEEREESKWTGFQEVNLLLLIDEVLENTAYTLRLTNTRVLAYDVLDKNSGKDTVIHSAGLVRQSATIDQGNERKRPRGPSRGLRPNRLTCAQMSVTETA